MSSGNAAAAAAANSDESAVKARLLFDGDGTGEDRRLNLLYRQVVKWCTSGCGGVNPEEDVKMHAKLNSALMLIEWSDAKSKLVQEMNVAEAGNYEQLLTTIQTKINQAEADIQEAKKELEQARLVRRNRMEYDAMAKQINKYPSRERTGKNISEVKSELERLRAEEESLDMKLQMRKNQFHVLVNSIHQLQALLDQEEEEEEAAAKSAANNGVKMTPNAASKGEEKTELNASNVSSNVDDTAPGHMDVS